MDIRRTSIVTIVLVALFALVMTGCEAAGAGGSDGTSSDGSTSDATDDTSGDSAGETGILRLSITDAPVDDEAIEGVWIEIESVQYNLNDEWQDMGGFEGPQSYDLLELTGGESALLGDLVLPAGEYTQIRFMLDVAETGQGAPSNPGSYLEIDDDGDDSTDPVQEPLFVPSAGQSGYKAQVQGEDGSFTVPANGEVAITADFDVRQALVKTGGPNSPNQRYILKPVLHLIVEDQAGSIEGSITNEAGADSLAVFAYEEGDFTSDEAADPGEEESRFQNAVTSAAATDTNGDGELDSYILPFLAEGTYDLVVAQYESDGTYVTGSGDAVDAEDIAVSAGETTTVDLTEEGLAAE